MRGNVGLWPIGLVMLVSGAIVSCARNEALPDDARAALVIQANDDPRVIERGRYLVHGPAHCAACHGDPAREADRRLGREVPLSGGKEFDLGPIGRVVVPNITSDPIGGIGALSAETIVRSLRFGISRRGGPLVPVMPFADLADSDLQAILSYLRTLPSTPGPPSRRELSWFARLGLRFAEPKGPTASPPRRALPARSADYGRYLTHTVANCVGCHTRRSRYTGTYNGPLFAGGMAIKEGERTFVTPNLTPAATGALYGSTEEEFIRRFRARGRVVSDTPMPWKSFARMTDADLGAIYRYLRTVPPAEMPRG